MNLHLPAATHSYLARAAASLQDLGLRRSDPLTRAASAWTALGSLPRSDLLVFTARVDDRGGIVAPLGRDPHGLQGLVP